MRAVSQLRAVGLALVAYTCWVLADTCLKIVGASALPPWEVIAVMGAAMVGVLLVRGVWRRDLRAIWPNDPLRQLLRAGLDVTNNFFVVIALRHLPLALFYILVFFAPMVTTLLAAWLLGESLEWRRGLAVFAGFVGVVIAVNPFGVTRAGDWRGYAACAVCVSAFSLSVVWSRKLTQTESPESLTFFTGGLMAVVGSVGLLLYAAPMSWGMAGMLLAAGFFGAVGSLCFFVALRHAYAGTVSQYHYSQLLTGALIGYLHWHERLTPAMLGGAVVIIAAGWYTAARSCGARGEGRAVASSAG